ncbi:MAG: DNA/RNA nuclease SfsA [Syntrophorhabdaceae bacterium]|nr:DNA/RNA nuclease SfsA [Syntrophorhabdaceae bacterium]
MNIKPFEGFEKAVFKKRLNRFLVESDINGKTILAHLPNPGRLWNLLNDGSSLFVIKDEKRDGRGTIYTAIAAVKDGRPVLLHTHYTNTIVERLIENKEIPGFEGYTVEKREVTMGNSRFDFMLRERKGNKRMLLEVKSCTLFHNGVALFPDAVTERGKKHLIELALSSYPGSVFFVVHSPSVDYFLPEYHVDPEFSETLYSLKDSISIRAFALPWTDELSLSGTIKPLSIPWHVYEREKRDGGGYILILYLPEDTIIKIGALGDLFFKRGYYVYVGSAVKNLTSRIVRHKKKHKRLFWHIDYLREKAELIHAIPVRSSRRIECDMAHSLFAVIHNTIAGFGVSDCKCPSHLFYMEQNPVYTRNFTDILFDYRTPSI